MDNDILKHIPAIATGIAEVGAAFNISKIGQMMLGPAAGELAEMWQDQIRMYRYERQLKCVRKGGADGEGCRIHAEGSAY